MKKLVSLLWLLLLCLSAGAQNTTVTATVVDTDSTTWANGTWNMQFIPNSSRPNVGEYRIAGVPLSPSVIQQQGSMNGTGALSVVVYQNGAITPSGSQWQLQVCPAASSKCGNYTFPTVGTSMDLSSALTPVIPAPRFLAVSGAYGYSDVEAITQNLIGATYYNVPTVCQRVFSGSSWACQGSTGPITPAGSGIADWIDNTSQCKPWRGSINVRDCGITGTGDETAKLKIALQAGKTLKADVFVPPDLTINVCDVILDSTTDGVRLHGPVMAANTSTQQATIKATAGCVLPIIDGYTNAFRRSMEIDHLMFDLNNTALFGIKNNFSILFNMHDLNFTNSPQGEVDVYEYLSEYDKISWTVSNGKGTFTFSTQCNHCQYSFNHVFTDGGFGVIGGQPVQVESPDWEGTLLYPYTANNAVIEFQDTTVGEYNLSGGAYMEYVASPACGITAASITSNVGSVTTNCLSPNIAVGKYISIAGTHQTGLDGNSNVVTSVAVGGSTITYGFNKTTADVSLTNYTITNIAYAGGIATFTVSSPHSEVQLDSVTISGTGTCYDNHTYYIDQAIATTTTISSTENNCTNNIGAVAGTATFGQTTGPGPQGWKYIFVANGDPLWISSTGSINGGQVAHNFGNYGIVGSAYGLNGLGGLKIVNFDSEIKWTLVSGNQSYNFCGYYWGASTGPPTNGKSLIPTVTTSSAAGLASTASSYYCGQHRFIMSSGSLVQTMVQEAALGTSIDLSLGNMRFFGNASPTTISTVTGQKLPNYTNAINTVNGVVAPQIFTAYSNNLNTTLANSQFNFASGADFVLQTNRPMLFQVNADATVREVGAWSTLLGKTAGAVWGSDGVKPVPSTPCTGIAKLNTSGAPTCATSGTDYLIQTNVPVASLVTTAAASDNVTVTGMTSSGHCQLTATNASAATNIATTFVSAKTTNQITVSHAATASMNYDVTCTSY